MCVRLCAWQRTNQTAASTMGVAKRKRSVPSKKRRKKSRGVVAPSINNAHMLNTEVVGTCFGHECSRGNTAARRSSCAALLRRVSVAQAQTCVLVWLRVVSLPSERARACETPPCRDSRPCVAVERFDLNNNATLSNNYHNVGLAADPNKIKSSMRTLVSRRACCQRLSV